MLKIKNKFIFFIIFVIISIIGFGIFNSYFEKNITRDSNVVLINGKASLNNSLLKINKKEKLSVGDTVRTIGENALAVLEWGDGSVTRLGGNTSIKIEELYVSDDLGKLNISFELFSGKSWSNVISFLGEDSYFKEYFRDSEAAARGTVFNVDLNNNYLHVLDHKISFTSSEGEKIILDEKNPLNLTTFNIIAFEEFLKSFKDKTWENINLDFDIQFLNGLKEQIHKDLDKLVDISNINFEEILSNDLNREELYNKLLTDYQKFNFIKPNDNDLFKKKLELKEILIKLANPEDKNILVENTLYDFKDIINLKDYQNLNIILPILSDNKEILNNINVNEFLNIDLIPEDLKNIMINNFGNLKGIFGEKFYKINNLNINIEKIKGNIHDGFDNGLEKVNNLFNK